MGNWSFLWHDVNTDHIMSRAMTCMKCTRKHDADQLPRYLQDLHQAKRTKKTLDSLCIECIVVRTHAMDQPVGFCCVNAKVKFGGNPS